MSDVNAMIMAYGKPENRFNVIHLPLKQDFVLHQRECLSSCVHLSQQPKLQCPGGWAARLRCPEPSLAAHDETGW